MLCLIAVLAVGGVQVMHVHSGTASNERGSFDNHCSLCLVAHCVLRPQQTHVLSLPARVLLIPPSPDAVRTFRTGLFHWFVRPPPAA